MCIAQVDSKLTNFFAATSEISSVTDPTYYGPDSIGVGESEISSLTEPTYGSGSGEGANAGVDGSAIGIGVRVNGGSGSGSTASASRSPPYTGHRPIWVPESDDDSSGWTWNFEEKFADSSESS